METRSARKYVKWGLAAAGLIFLLALPIIAAPWASKKPDTLEKAAKDLRFEDKAVDSHSILPGYTVPGAKSADSSTRLSALIGVFVVTTIATALAMGLSLLSRRRKARRAGNDVGDPQ